MLVKFTPTTNGFTILVNTTFLGSLERKEDGYYDWYPSFIKPGYISSNILQAICNKLDTLNLEWDNTIKEYMNNAS